MLDLGELEFIDSSGISVIIPGPRAVQRVFELCGLNKILTFAAGHPHAAD